MLKKSLLIALVSGLLLSACGVKGPLYFPENAPENSQQNQTK